MKHLYARWKEADSQKKIIAIFFGTIFFVCLLWGVWQIALEPIFRAQTGRGTMWGRHEYDGWTDFFNVNYWAQNGFNPYTSDFRSSYPPLVLLIAKLFSFLADYSRDSFVVAKTFWGIFSYHLAFVGFSALSFLAWCKMMKDRGCSLVQGILVGVALLLTTPYLYAYERGNYILVVVTCLSWYFAWLHSEKRWQREVALILLAIAAGIKLYPALLAAILLKERRFLDFFKTCIYTVAAFFLPFLAFSGGFSNVSMFFENLTTFQGLNPASALNYSMPTFLLYFAQIANGLSLSTAPSWVFTVGEILSAAILFLGLFLSLFSDRTWKSLALVTVALIVYPAPSFLYSASMLLPVAVLFLIDEKAKKIDFLYLALFLAILTPLRLGTLVSPDVFPGGLWLDNLLQHLAMLTLFGLLSYESITNLCHRISRRKKNSLELS